VCTCRSGTGGVRTAAVLEKTDWREACGKNELIPHGWPHIDPYHRNTSRRMSAAEDLRVWSQCHRVNSVL
jgi:hypothetical protein